MERNSDNSARATNGHYKLSPLDFRPGDQGMHDSVRYVPCTVQQVYIYRCCSFPSSAVNYFYPQLAGTKCSGASFYTVPSVATTRVKRYHDTPYELVATAAYAIYRVTCDNADIPTVDRGGQSMVDKQTNLLRALARTKSFITMIIISLHQPPPPPPTLLP